MGGIVCSWEWGEWHISFGTCLIFNYSYIDTCRIIPVSPTHMKMDLLNPDKNIIIITQYHNEDYLLRREMIKTIMTYI